MRRDFQKSINSTWTNTRVNKDRIHKVPFSNCNHRLAYLRKWHIQKEIDISKLYISLWQYRCNPGFSGSVSNVHHSVYSEIFVMCWIESVDPVADLCLRNQIYSVLLNAFEFKEITRNHWSTKYFKMLLEDEWKVTKRDLVVASTRHHCARLLKYYPRPPWAPILVKWRMIRPLPIYISYILNKYSLSLYVYAQGILGCLLGFWPLGQTALRGQ